MLASTVTGRGPEVLLVHGGMSVGSEAWVAQSPLAERWTLRAVDRAGYGASAHLSPGEDIRLDAEHITEQLTDPVHLVGHSSGAIVAMLVAASAPAKIRSLTVIEPPSYRFVDAPEVQALADGGDALWAAVDLPDRAWLVRFFEVYGGAAPPEEILVLFDPHVPVFRRFAELPWKVELPVVELRGSDIPSLVVSGGHNPAFELLNDGIADAIGAPRAVVPGAGHAVQFTGAPFNDVLEAHLRGA